MEVYCTRPGCPRPVNHFTDLDDSTTLKTVQQKFCTTCGMPLILVGRYLPIKLLGQGGFGAAFLARDRYTPSMRQCVVKQFQPAGDLNPNQLQVAQSLFEREGHVLEDLGNRHPQIPDLLAYFELLVPDRHSNQPDRFFYLVQEFIDGQDMEQELEQKGKFSEAEVRELLIGTLKILKFVHESGSIHRDIKPSNIMRDRRDRLYLLDFGAVKQVTAGAASSTSGAKSSTGIYSMGYAPPEQMAGNIVYPATDLYALGVTCITLLTGKQPSELYDPYSNSWNWRGFAQVSDLLEGILNRMLIATPSQRFQSADEVLSALASSGRPNVSAAPPPPPVTPPPPPPPQSGSPPPKLTSIQSPKAAPAAAPSAPAGSPAVPVALTSPKSSFSASTLELLGNAAFTGFEGGLLAIALLSVLGTTVISAGFWIILLGGLIFMQSRRIIEKADLFILAAITLVLVLFVPIFNRFAPIQAFGNSLVAILFVALFMGLFGVAVMTLFRLVYKLLSRFL